MFITYIVLYTFGFYILYCTSGRAVIYPNPVFLWAQKHARIAKILGYALMISNTALMMFIYGFGTGLYFGLILLTTISSLAIVLLPILTTHQRK